MKTVLLLIPTTSYRTDDFMAAAGKLDIDIVLGTDERQSLESLSAGRIQTFDFEDVEAGGRQIADFVRSHRVDAIVPVDDGANLLAAAAAARIGMAHNSPDAVASARNKYLFREKLAAANCRNPEYRLVNIGENPAAVAREVGFPCVLKPLTLNMSRGVIRADGHNSFVAAFDKVAEIIARPDARTPGMAAEHVLVERYIPGKEYAVEGLIRRGRLTILAIFDKPDPLEGPYFEETIYVTPAPVDDALRNDIHQAAEAAIQAIGLADGPTHIDLRVNEDGVYIIEADARTIGGRCGRSLQFAGGVRLEEIVLRHALEMPLDGIENTAGAGGVMMIPIPKSGVLRGTEGIEAARQVPLVQEVSITIPVGQTVMTLPDAGRYLGFIIAHGDDPDSVTTALRDAHERLVFAIDSDD